MVLPCAAVALRSSIADKDLPFWRSVDLTLPIFRNTAEDKHDTLDHSRSFDEVQHSSGKEQAARRQ